MEDQSSKRFNQGTFMSKELTHEEQKTRKAEETSRYGAVNAQILEHVRAGQLALAETHPLHKIAYPPEDRPVAAQSSVPTATPKRKGGRPRKVKPTADVIPQSP